MHFCEEALLLILLELGNGFLEVETSFVGGHVEKVGCVLEIFA